MKYDENKTEKGSADDSSGCYIRPEAAFEKLMQAREAGRTVYLHAGMGFGKTRLVQEFLKGEDCLWLRAKQGRFSSVPDRRKSEQAKILVVDDLMWLTEAQDQELLLEWLEQRERFVLLLSRVQLPGWLMTVYCRHPFLLIGEEDLRFRKKELEEFLASQGLRPVKRELEEMLFRTRGQPMAAGLLAAHMKDGMNWGAELVQRMKKELAGYMSCELRNCWEPVLYRFIMWLSIVDSFTICLAEMISGRSDVELLLEKIRQVGDFLFQEGEEYWFQSDVLASMRARLAEEYTKEQQNELYYNAGLYYERTNSVEKALQMYETCGNYSRISRILVRNAETPINSSHYYQLRKYYFALPKEFIMQSVPLMVGVCTLYSLLLQPEESEKWYRILKKYCARQSQGSMQRKEAASQLAYLDVALPHRGSGKQKEMLISLYRLVLNRSIVLPEFSVTSNLPSLMNGGKDYCSWSPYDRTLAVTIARPVVTVLGKYGVGLVDIAVAESQYEKGGRNAEIMEMLNRGRYQAENEGKIEMVFVAVGLLTRLLISSGDFAGAGELLADFRRRAERERAWQLIPNISALECRMALLCGDLEKAESWLKEAPKEDVEFYILDRYRYLTKIRIYIWQEKWYAALSLIQRMRHYSKMYDRKYICMECRLLLAICQFRRKDAEWKETFCGLLRETARYGFTALITEEGAAVQKLLKACKAQEAGVSEEYYRRLRVGAASMAQHYPAYLQSLVQDAGLSRQEMKVLGLLCSGMTGKEIAAVLCISMATVRYHSHNIYRKLGVESKAEAVRIASEKKLV